MNLEDGLLGFVPQPNLRVGLAMPGAEPAGLFLLAMSLSGDTDRAASKTEVCVGCLETAIYRH